MTRKTWALGGAVLLGAVFVTLAITIVPDPGTAPASEQPQVHTAEVQQGELSDLVSAYGTLTYRGRADGSPHTVINQDAGTYTALPQVGDEIGCGEVLYQVDDRPVLLLCGAVPAYRSLHTLDSGNDVRQLNQNLHDLGYDTAAGVSIDPNAGSFTAETQEALAALQQDKALPVTGVLALGDAVFLPEAVRMSTVAVELGGLAQPGAAVGQATSDRPEVQVQLDPAQQGAVEPGALAQITLPDNQTVTGKVERIGNVAQGPAGPDGAPGEATVLVYVTLDEPERADGLDHVSVRVAITTAGVENALSVPVTAIIGQSGGGFAVEVVRDDGRREMVAVELGLFDDAAGRVQVDGDLREGDHVVVPSL